MTAGWPYHKFMAVRRAYQAEGRRQARVIARAKGNDDVIEWTKDSFTRPF